MPEAGQGPTLSKDFDPEVDHYPELKTVFAEVLRFEELPEGPIERVEVTCLASGDATCRVWAARSEEPVGMLLDTRTSS